MAAQLLTNKTMSQIKTLNLIEPTLYDQTGHSYMYVQCLLQANPDFNFKIQVWLDQRGRQLLARSACIAHTYFYRPLRQVQKIFLYYKLLKQPEIILISTAELWDLKILAFFARYFKIKSKVFLQFHQFKQTKNKLASLKKIANLNLDFTIITPTEKLEALYKNHGFKRCVTIACPTYQPAKLLNSEPEKFSKVLYAGAARNDKGFAQVIDLLQYNRSIGKDTLFEIQTSMPNSQRYDATSAAALLKLKTLPQHNLILHATTLDQQQYLNLFKNSICLLLYSQQEYQDKFSAIALDAFYAGCPIITAKNTWMGDAAQRYNSGIALDDFAPATVQLAIDEIINNYTVFHVNAKHAAQQLLSLHDPKHTLEFIKLAANPHQPSL